MYQRGPNLSRTHRLACIFYDQLCFILYHLLIFVACTQDFYFKHSVVFLFRIMARDVGIYIADLVCFDFVLCFEFHGIYCGTTMQSAAGSNMLECLVSSLSL